MNDELPKSGAYRTTVQISELQVKLGIVADRILRDIESAQTKIEATKKEVASRWNKVAGVSAVDRSRLSNQESGTRVREIIDDVVLKLDDSYDNAQELYREIKEAEVFYPGKMQFLMNATIMSDSRAKYATALTMAGPMELAGYASYAIGVQDSVMAAAVIQANDALPTKERRFLSVAVANRIEIPAWNSLQSALKLAYVLSQQIETAVRTFKSGRPSPIDTIRLAMLKNDLKTEGDSDE